MVVLTRWKVFQLGVVSIIWEVFLTRGNGLQIGGKGFQLEGRVPSRGKVFQLMRRVSTWRGSNHREVVLTRGNEREMSSY